MSEMKIKFKDQEYQTLAVKSVVDCFKGQLKSDGLHHGGAPSERIDMDDYWGRFRNAEIKVSDPQLLQNINDVQKRRGLTISKSLDDFVGLNPKDLSGYKKIAKAIAPIHLDIEMETGTGKTYCYIKTIFEMHKRYGWSKFIVVVPSVAIREGVLKSLEITADHFAETYKEKARFFGYDSKRLHELDAFSSDGKICVMVVNTQAFNSKSKDNRRIYAWLDEFQSRKPIDVISAARPILILDEPQKIKGDATLKSLPLFKPLFVLRYSATHIVEHNRVHRLNAVEAFNMKLVKKIVVRGIKVQGRGGSDGYMYLEQIETSKENPVARIEFEVKSSSGKTNRKIQRIKVNDSLFLKSKKMEQYRGYTIKEIDAVKNEVKLSNGIVLNAGQPVGDIYDEDIRRIQIRETIRAHLEKERQLFSRGIKVLSLFFVDEVKKYRDYDVEDAMGEYAKIFEDEYEEQMKDFMSQNYESYNNYLKGIKTRSTHKGYFSIDRRTKKFTNPAMKRDGYSDDVDAYDLILKDKERLLSLEEPVRFIFSHSALREGWDNPNVFSMCMLKRSESTISRRQEVGRGLRLCVDQSGERVDDPADVHDVNELTVVANESYSEFVDGLQTEISTSLTGRSLKATEEYFAGKVIDCDNEKVVISELMARKIYHYLVRNSYVDEENNITETYHDCRDTNTLAPLSDGLVEFSEQIFQLIDTVFGNCRLPKVEDGRMKRYNSLNSNFDRKEFVDLWNRINKKASYQVDFRSSELIKKCVKTLNRDLHVPALHYVIERGAQDDSLTDKSLRKRESFAAETKISWEEGRAPSTNVEYDLVGLVAESCRLKRSTAAGILSKIKSDKFKLFSENPEHFISEVSKIVKDQRSTVIIEDLTYNIGSETYDIDIFTENQLRQDFSGAIKVENHIYDYVVYDSKVEKNFAEKLDQANEVEVYAKLPRGFQIPTPVGNYNPDWAISFKADGVRHTYFVAETKGSLSSMNLRGAEKSKIKCARKFFEKIGGKGARNRVNYKVVTNFSELMQVVRHKKDSNPKGREAR